MWKNKLLVQAHTILHLPPSSVPGGWPSSAGTLANWFLVESGQWKARKQGKRLKGKRVVEDSLNFLSAWPQVGSGSISFPKTNTSVGIFRVLVTPWVLETSLFICLFRLRGGNVVSFWGNFSWCLRTLSTPLSIASSLNSSQLFHLSTAPVFCPNLDWYRGKAAHKSIWTLSFLRRVYVLQIKMYYAMVEILGRGILFLH